MKTWIALVACFFAQVAGAEVLFEDRSDGLPEHIYSGGWTHFVGGGVAAFDCNNDALPDLFAAGGNIPAKLMRNTGDFAFVQAEVPELTGVTGAYPLDINADGIMDLFVLRVGPNVVLQGGLECSFTDVTQAWGFPEDDRWSTAFSAWWTPKNDRPAMAIGNYVDRSDPDGPFEACDDNQDDEQRQEQYQDKVQHREQHRPKTKTRPRTRPKEIPKTTTRPRTRPKSRSRTSKAKTKN